VIKSRELNPQDLQQLSLGLVKEVVALHSRDCIHGEITPQAVIIKEDNSMKLMYPDFSKKPVGGIALDKHVSF